MNRGVGAARCLVVAAVTIGAATACAGMTDGHPIAPVTAFPDPAGYPAVDGSGYSTSDTRRYFAGPVFVTPQGQHCSKNVRDYAHRLWCSGPRPDTGGYWDTSFGPADAATSKPAEQPADPTAPDAFTPVPAGHRIELGDGMVCVVGDGGLFACRAGDHGFVMTPAATRLF